MGLNLSEDLFFPLHLILGQKNRTKFEWRPFFLLFHLILGKKLDWFWVEEFLILFFVLLKFSEVPAPFFSKSCVRYCLLMRVFIMILLKKGSWVLTHHRRSQDFLIGGGANYKSHAMTSSETSKKEFFVGAKISEEWKIRSRGLVLACN